MIPLGCEAGCPENVKEKQLLQGILIQIVKVLLCPRDMAHLNRNYHMSRAHETITVSIQGPHYTFILMGRIS